jgi:hypothetical protein
MSYVLAHVHAHCYPDVSKGFLMTSTARRRQPPITIRSSRATELLRRLAVSGRSQAEIIEDALERLAGQSKTLAQALAPEVPHGFEWDVPRSMISAPAPDFDD